MGGSWKPHHDISSSSGSRAINASEWSFKDPKKKDFRMYCGKRKNAGNQHFLFF